MAKKENPTKGNDSDFMIVGDEQMEVDAVEAESSPSRTPFPAKQPCPNGDKFPDDITLITYNIGGLDPHNLKIRLNAVMQIIAK